ncbi:hypothetical protein HGRIS_011631 [Hohenbuehelia grisea]|uniref:DUF6534 domain-containing protein n=1 Tax=Hohenbuehelia grisea TaxID=104357 RepID=A0ABR3JVQ8_9AGAR
MRDAFALYGSGYGNVSLLINIPFIWLSVPIMSGIVSCTVQIFFAYRIQLLSGSKLIGLLIVVLALLEGIAAVVVGIQLKEIVSFPKLQSSAFVSKAVWMSGSALCDILIAVLMCHFLSVKNNGLRSTRMYVNRLMRLIIETGAVTALAATADLIIFFAFPHNNFHTVPCLIMSKFYSNTAFAILNSRMHIRGARNTLPSVDVATFGSLHFTPENGTSTSTGTSNVGTRNLQIQDTRGGLSVVSVPVDGLVGVKEHHWGSHSSVEDVDVGLTMNVRREFF